MTNAEIMTIAAGLTADARVMGFSRNGVTIEIHFVAAGEGMFQLRQTNGPADVTAEGFPFTEAGLTEARAIARLRAELIGVC
jgi:hypothetical protein